MHSYRSHTCADLNKTNVGSDVRLSGWVHRIRDHGGVLFSAIIRNLSEKEMTVYRKPFLSELERRPTLDWPRQIPINGEPEEVCEIVEKYSVWMAENEIPKLFINAEPGSILVGKQREFCRAWKNQKEVTTSGTHFIQEDSPHEIGQAISEWVKTI